MVFTFGKSIRHFAMPYFDTVVKVKGQNLQTSSDWTEIHQEWSLWHP